MPLQPLFITLQNDPSQFATLSKTFTKLCFWAEKKKRIFFKDSKLFLYIILISFIFFIIIYSKIKYKNILNQAYP